MIRFDKRVWRARYPVSDDDRCGWLATTGAARPTSPLTGAHQVDAVVVGAGFTGLAAARRLAELCPDWRLLVLDAQRAGWGGSGRASGFLVDQAGFVGAMPKPEAGRYLRLSHAGIATLDELRARYGIDCDWDDRGWLHVAASDAGLRGLDQLEPWLATIGRRAMRLDDEAMARLTGTRFYRAGLRMPGSVLVHAGKLVRGLAAHLPPPVELFEHSPVTTIERLGGGGGYRLSTPAASVTAPKVVLALNGYAPLLGFLADRLFPLVTFGTLTRPLDHDEQAHLGEESEWGLLAQDPMGSSLRRTRDQRILVRNTIHYTPGASADADSRSRMAEVHRRVLAARWPALANVDFDGTWAGVMGATPSLRPFFGRLDEGLVTAAAFTGAGIAMGTILGRLLAEELLDLPSSLLDDARRLGPPRKLPPEPFLSPGIKWKTRQMNATAGATL